MTVEMMIPFVVVVVVVVDDFHFRASGHMRALPQDLRQDVPE
jgi:hypothetical protein